MSVFNVLLPFLALTPLDDATFFNAVLARRSLAAGALEGVTMSGTGVNGHLGHMNILSVS